MEDYNLIYYHKESGKMYLAKRVTKLDYILYDPETETKLPISSWAISQSYNADKGNHKRKKRVGLKFKNFES